MKKLFQLAFLAIIPLFAFSCNKDKLIKKGIVVDKAVAISKTNDDTSNQKDLSIEYNSSFSDIIFMMDDDREL